MYLAEIFTAETTTSGNVETTVSVTSQTTGEVAKNSTDPAKMDSTEPTTVPITEETTDSATTNATMPPSVMQFCESDRYFLQEHELLSSLTKNKKEKEYDWYYNMNNILYRYQQALFFMFTVIGFIFLLTSIGMRVDAVLNEKWSSSLLVIFLLYSISMSLTAKVFALQSGSDGVR